MKDYPEISDFLIGGAEHIIPPETERKIIEFMEEVERCRKREQAQAMIDARNIILDYDGRIGEFL